MTLRIFLAKCFCVVAVSLLTFGCATKAPVDKDHGRIAYGHIEESKGK